MLTYQTISGVAKSTTTGANGDCVPIILDLADVSDATSPAASVTKPGFEPQTAIFSKLIGGNSYDAVVSLVKLENNVSIPVDGGTLWHLGDGRFSDEINSKFQKANDGPTMELVIADWAAKVAAGFTQATVYLDHKGWQTTTCPTNSIEIVGDAGRAPRPGVDSPGTGDWGGGASAPILPVFNVADIGATSAKIVITAGVSNGPAPGDLDDFEITRLRVVCSN